MTEENTPNFDSDNSLDNFLSQFSNKPSNRKSPSVCTILLISKNQALSVKLYENDFIELGRLKESSRARINLSLLIQPGDGVSRRHAILYFVGGRLLVADLESQNGTYLHGERLEATKPVEVVNGDHLILGRLNLCLQIEITEHQ